MSKRYRPIVAAGFSLILPGWGQIYSGRRRIGYGMLLLTTGVVMSTLIFLSKGKLYLAKLSVDPEILLTALVSNALLLMYRVFAVVDAFLGARAGTSPIGWWRLTAFAGLVVAVFAPHAFVARRQLAAHDLLTTVFASSPQASTPAPSQPIGTGENGSTATSTAAFASPLWEGRERLNILLLGGDAGVGRRDLRTDTMIVVSIDPLTGWAAMFSTPRNFVEVPLPDGVGRWADCNCYPGYLNDLYDRGLRYPDVFPGGPNTGANAIKAGLSAMMQIDIHNYALVNLEGFVALIDALGGVTITVTEEVYDSEYPHEDGTTEVIDIKEGTHDMDGHLALAYARSRRMSDDYNRMGRQRCVLEAVLEQSDATELLVNFPKLAEVIKDSMETDIPVDLLPDLIELASIVDTEQIVSVRFIPPRYVAGRNESGFPIPSLDEIRRVVAGVMELPPAEAIAKYNLPTLDDACG